MSSRNRPTAISTAAASVILGLSLTAPPAAADPATPVSTSTTASAIVELCSASACLVSVTGTDWDDTDGDGVLDPDETAFGTDPTIKASAPSAAVVFDSIREDAMPSFTAGHSFVVVLPTQLPGGTAIGGSAAPTGRQDVLRSLGIDFRGVDLRFGVTVSRSSLANDPFGPQRRELRGLSVASSTDDTRSGNLPCAVMCEFTQGQFADSWGDGSGGSPSSPPATGGGGRPGSVWESVKKGHGDRLDTVTLYQGRAKIASISGSRTEMPDGTTIKRTHYEEYDKNGRVTSTVDRTETTQPAAPLTNPEPGTTGTQQKKVVREHAENADGTTTDTTRVIIVKTVTDANGDTTRTTTTNGAVTTTNKDGEQSTTVLPETEETEKVDGTGKYISGDFIPDPPTTMSDLSDVLERLTWNARYEPTEIRALDQAWSPEVKRSLLILTDPTLADSVPGVPNTAMELPLVFFTTVNPACQYEPDVCSDITHPSELPPGPQPGQVPTIG